jgi:copper transport protein
VRSDPSDRAVLLRAPSIIRLWFSEPAYPIGFGIRVVSPSGRTVAEGQIHRYGDELTTAIATHERGTFLIHWQVISVDTHPTRGRIAFSVGRVTLPAGFTGTSGELGDVSPVGLVLQTLGRWLHFAGYALGFGSLAFLLLVLRPLSLSDPEPAKQRLYRLVVLGIIGLLVAEPVTLLAQTSSFGAPFDPGVATDILSSNFGRVVAQRLGVALLLWVLLGTIKQGSRRAAVGALALAPLLALVDGEASHAAGAGPLWFGLGINMLHVVAMGVWVGGLVSLLTVLRLPVLDGHRGALVSRFGRLAGGSLSVLIATGLIMAWLHLKVPSALLTTAYGQALIGKLLLLGVVALLAMAGRRAPPSRYRLWLMEAAVLLGVLAVSGLVVSLPPP